MKILSTFVIAIYFFVCIYWVPALPTGHKVAYSKIDNFQNLWKGNNSFKCTVCKDIIGFLHGVGSVGIGKGDLEVFATYVCKKGKIESDRVCNAVIKEFAGELWGVLIDAFVEPSQICGWIFGDSCAHFVDYFSPWNITIPPKNKNTKSPWEKTNKLSGKPWKVLQITDIHLDYSYMEGSKADCNEPLCCRNDDGPAGQNNTKAPKWGYNGGYCDSNVLMVQNMFETLAAEHSDVDYILWTGDVPAHNIWNQSREDQVNAIKLSSKLIVKYFPGIKVYPALGNHEGSPVNSFPPPFVTGDSSGQWLRDALADDWSQWLPEDTKETIKNGGYYTVLVEKGFRIISLNMNYGNSGNWWLWINSTDPAAQLQWLVSQLLKAEENDEKVHIVGHIPPDATLQWFSFNYFRIVNRFKDTISAQFFGHTHHDEFRIFYDEKTYKTPISVVYISPSVTTYHHMNPGFRIYEVDGGSANSTWVVTDHHTYILNLTKVNATGKPIWEYEYGAKESYGLSSLSPTEWSKLVYRMLDDDKQFALFYRTFTKQYIQDTCTGACKKNYLCSLNTAEGSGFHNYCEFQTESEREMFLSWKKETYNKC